MKARFFLKLTFNSSDMRENAVEATRSQEVCPGISHFLVTRLPLKKSCATASLSVRAISIIPFSIAAFRVFYSYTIYGGRNQIDSSLAHSNLT